MEEVVRPPGRRHQNGGIIQSFLPLVAEKRPNGHYLRITLNAGRISAFPPLCPTYAPPPNSPTIPDDATDGEIRDARSALDILHCDYTVLQGCILGFGENIRDAVDTSLYQDLKHVRFGYNDI